MELSLTTLFVRLASDVDLDPSSVSYCVRRIKSEGLKFLTVTLPKLSRAVMDGLEVGYLDRTTLTCFAWKRQSLRYFTKFLDRIFDPATGSVLPSVDALCIYSIRQLCEYSYKLALEFTEKEVEAATSKFVKIDNTVPTTGEYDYDYVDQLRKDFETHYRSLSASSVADILNECPPRPGPGTFSGLRDYSAATGLPWYARKHDDLSVPEQFAHYAYASRPFKRQFAFSEQFDCFEGPKPLKRLPVPAVVVPHPYSEVLFVPKDSRGPRTIVREPFAILRYHMAFNKFIAGKLEKISRGRINFQDQAINRAMAQASSLTREWATIDLSNASDSVSTAIMAHIFRHSPGLLQFVRSRTKTAILPQGDKIELRKLAGMGSGLTFPCMSLLIHLAITRALVKDFHISYETARKLVFVYGDDIIVPSTMVSSAFKALSRVSLHVNKDKSFWRGYFRESCGGDYFRGQDVSPVRLKLPGARTSYCNKKLSLNCDGTLAYVELERHCRELTKAGLLALASYYYLVLEKHLGALPRVSGDSPVLGRFSIRPIDYEQDGAGTYREIRCIMPVPVLEKHQVDPYIYLKRKVTRSIPTLEDHLYPSGQGSSYCEVEVPHQIKLKRTKISSYRLMG